MKASPSRRERVLAASAAVVACAALVCCGPNVILDTSQGSGNGATGKSTGAGGSQGRAR